MMDRWTNQHRIGRPDPALREMNQWNDRRRRREQEQQENALLLWVVLLALALGLLAGA